MKKRNTTSKKQMLKRAILVCGILASALSVGMGAMSEIEWQRTIYDCLKNGDKSGCQALIDSLPSVEECHKYKYNGESACGKMCLIYDLADNIEGAIPYCEKALTLEDGEDDGSKPLGLGLLYFKLNDYFNAKKYYEIGCNKANIFACDSLGRMYEEGQGVRQDYHKAAEFYKKACDMEYAGACNQLGLLYFNGQGVRQNLSIAKQYAGKACDLGNQIGCDNYKSLHSQGVQ